MNPARYAKAIVAGLSAGLLAVQAAITMSDQAHNWVTVGIAVLATIAVYIVPNEPPPGSPASTAPPAARRDGDAP